MSHLTDAEMAALQLSDLPRDTPFLIAGVSRSQFSIARHSGGCTFQGKTYTYIRPTDELVRADVLKWISKLRAAEARAALKPVKA